MVVIHNLELSSEADNTASSSLLQLGLESLEESSGSGALGAGGSTTNGVTEDVRAEFSVGEITRAISVVNTEKCVKVLKA